MGKHHLDLVGDVCPVPLLRTERKVQEMQVGDVLVIQTEQPNAVRNIIDWAQKNGHALEVKNVGRGLWELSLTKNPKQDGPNDAGRA